MPKTILLTGATDGIGLETAKMLAPLGHHLLLHGRSAAKLEQTKSQVASLPGAGPVETYAADLSDMKQVEALAAEVSSKHEKLDVLINNAGVFMTPTPVTPDGLDIRFAVNTVAPYLLATRLTLLMGPGGRVVNLSSAAQAKVDLQALAGQNSRPLPDKTAYAQSKLAITMWTNHLAALYQDDGPLFVAVNPGSLLGSKMVRDAYGMAGGDLKIGADILTRAALSEEFAHANGKYFDNDSGRFASPHRDATQPKLCAEVVNTMQTWLAAR
ncbi:SDR family NAD(P)-dependent oxidoreductase [Algisphaera agarilytica]|uniref:NAD(P)-dependent dehydrogenase (Short-subunit alcohol dehydrogenase family) n=1 Tax=Algisphaera agarilytica TaxID=1385975 RepID=A0A7X0H9I9_9BACT|nr:SDR family NAD(P)-dependent oxidoreductase [Algisphaera agarilytica]MBB6430330.1 NAD(P)-dependent dehydrogenase (short-subunit alcohol dehydrogenase family) [Algisphaera agarilytica]